MTSPRLPKDIKQRIGEFADKEAYLVTCLGYKKTLTGEKLDKTLKMMEGHHLQTHILTQEKLFDLVLVSLPVELNFSIEEFAKFSDRYANNPVMIKQGEKVKFYGCGSNNQWQLVEMPDHVVANLNFPKLGSEILLSSFEIPANVHSQIIDMKAHVDDSIHKLWIENNPSVQNLRISKLSGYKATEEFKSIFKKMMDWLANPSNKNYKDHFEKDAREFLDYLTYECKVLPDDVDVKNRAFPCAVEHLIEDAALLVYLMASRGKDDNTKLLFCVDLHKSQELIIKQASAICGRSPKSLVCRVLNYVKTEEQISKNETNELNTDLTSAAVQGLSEEPLSSLLQLAKRYVKEGRAQIAIAIVGSQDLPDALKDLILLKDHETALALLKNNKDAAKNFAYELTRTFENDKLDEDHPVFVAVRDFLKTLDKKTTPMHAKTSSPNRESSQKSQPGSSCKKALTFQSDNKPSGSGSSPGSSPPHSPSRKGDTTEILNCLSCTPTSNNQNNKSSDSNNQNNKSSGLPDLNHADQRSSNSSPGLSSSVSSTGSINSLDNSLPMSVPSSTTSRQSQGSQHGVSGVNSVVGSPTTNELAIPILPSPESLVGMTMFLSPRSSASLANRSTSTPSPALEPSDSQRRRVAVGGGVRS